MIVGQGSLNYFIRSGLIHKMQVFSEPVICLRWEEPDLQQELQDAGFEVHVLPIFKPEAIYIKLRIQLNAWYYACVLKSVSTKIEYRYLFQAFRFRKKLSKIKGSFLEKFNRLSRPGYIKNLIAQEEKLIQMQPGYDTIKEWLHQLNLHAYFTATPFLLSSELVGRLCKNAGLPVFAAICSFDNVTKRGWPAIFFDHYIIWNKYNKAELQRINPLLKDEQISITGAPQFDAHILRSNHLSKEKWLQALGLPADKKIILYGGGPSKLLPYETQYLKHLKVALEKGEIKNAVLLFRSHPLDDLQRWVDEVGESEYIFYDSAPTGKENRDYTNVTIADIEKLIATLKFTDIHINLCSTMTVDGSIFNKPQIAPFYDLEKPGTQKLLRDLYFQEHYLPIVKSGAIHFAKSKKELIGLVKNSLENPATFILGNKKCVEEIISFTDGKSAERVAATIQTLLGA